LYKYTELFLVSQFIIARTVSQAIKAKKPKTRYVAGFLAKPVILIQKWLGDRILDKIITNPILK
jgi:hypothetical protein